MMSDFLPAVNPRYADSAFPWETGRPFVPRSEATPFQWQLSVKIRRQFAPQGDLLLSERDNEEGLFILRLGFDFWRVGRIVDGRPAAAALRAYGYDKALGFNLEPLLGRDVTLQAWLQARNYGGLRYDALLSAPRERWRQVGGDIPTPGGVARVVTCPDFAGGHVRLPYEACGNEILICGQSDEPGGDIGGLRVYSGGRPLIDIEWDHDERVLRRGTAHAHHWRPQRFTLAHRLSEEEVALYGPLVQAVRPDVVLRPELPTAGPLADKLAEFDRCRRGVIDY